MFNHDKQRGQNQIKEMQEKKFHREDYPIKILAEFGLTEEMIYDLPDFVHQTIEIGGKSPLLPISIEQPFGETQAYAKFSLTETDHGIDVLFFPKLKSVNLEQFGEHDKKLLLNGKVIVADIAESKSEESDDKHCIKAFVQIDKDTNDVVYTPTKVIGRNLSAVAREYGLDGTDLQRFWTGELVTINEANEQGGTEPVTIGIDLFTENGLVVIPGTAERWEKTVRRVMPEYSFGNDGCWVNRNGELQYVPDDKFTKDLWDALQKSSQQNEIKITEGKQEECEITYDSRIEKEELRQLSR